MDFLQITYMEWANLSILFLVIALIIRKKIAFCLSLGAILTGFVVWGIALYIKSSIYGAIWAQLGIFLAAFLLLLALFPQEWAHLQFRSKMLGFHPHKGQILVLSSPIVRGESILEIEGKKWTIVGPSLKIGSSVKVRAVDGRHIFVEKYIEQEE